MPLIGNFRRTGRNSWKYKDRIFVEIAYHNKAKWARRQGYGIIIHDKQGKHSRVIAGLRRWTDAYNRATDEIGKMNEKFKKAEKNS